MKILVSALEHSANVHLKSLKKEMSEDVEFIGIFDKELGEPIIDLRSLAIMGFVGAIAKLPFFYKLNNQMAELVEGADKVLLIDSSGFNLPLAKKIKKLNPNKEIIYYILPQAWAWRRGRIAVLEQTIDKLCSILPFEKDYYSPLAPIEYVGHPLLDQITEFKTQLNEKVENVLFMPGSRKAEISKLMPVYRELRGFLNANATLVIPNIFSNEEIDELYGDISGFEVREDAHKEMLNADFGFICSGTATLEASLIGIPFILSYIAKPIDYFIVKKLAKIKEVGLGNIMFLKYKGRVMHPEFLQEDVTVQNLLNAYKEYKRDAFLDDSKELRTYLEHGSAKRMAAIVEG